MTATIRKLRATIANDSSPNELCFAHVYFDKVYFYDRFPQAEDVTHLQLPEHPDSRYSELLIFSNLGTHATR